MRKPITLTIKTGTSLTEIEDCYDLLDNSDTPVNIKLPIKLAYGGAFGIGSAVIQLIGSWARTPNSSSLRSYPSRSGNVVFKQMLENPHGLIAAYMSSEITGELGKILDKNTLLRHAENQVDAMYAGNLNDTLKGPGVFLACFAGAKKEFIQPFYKHPDTSGVRGTSDFLHLTENILSFCDPGFKDKMPTIWMENIAVLVRELFENTNDHAAQDEKNRAFTWTYPNVRGLIAKKVIIHSEGRFDMIKEGYSALSFSKLLMQSAKPSVPMIELTVFDLGPGIAKRYLSVSNPPRELLSIPIEEEKEIVEDAFSLGFSTKEGSGVGVGLDSVVKSLGRLNAYVRLRTGRLCLWQEFSRGTQEIAFDHFFPKRHQLACSAGTTFSILIPSN